MIVLTNSHYVTFIHFSSKGWENVLCELGSERVKLLLLTTACDTPLSVRLPHELLIWHAL